MAYVRIRIISRWISCLRRRIHTHTHTHKQTLKHTHIIVYRIENPIERVYDGKLFFDHQRQNIYIIYIYQCIRTPNQKLNFYPYIFCKCIFQFVLISKKYFYDLNEHGLVTYSSIKKAVLIQIIIL